MDSDDDTYEVVVNCSVESEEDYDDDDDDDDEAVVTVSVFVAESFALYKLSPAK
jgi:hypothetical protein